MSKSNCMDKKYHMWYEIQVNMISSAAAFMKKHNSITVAVLGLKCGCKQVYILGSAQTLPKHFNQSSQYIVTNKKFFKLQRGIWG